MNIIYPYSTDNRLLNPCSYMYTPFEGLPFFKGHSLSRKSFMESIEELIISMKEPDDLKKEILKHSMKESLGIAKIGTIEDYSQKLLLITKHNPWISSKHYPDTNNTELSNYADMIKITNLKDRVETEKFLVCLFCYVSGNFAHSDSMVAWTESLIQRFEVTKKIYPEYKPGFKKGSGKNDVLFLYVLFAISLSIYYGQTQNLRYLNAVLKINDLIISNAAQLIQDGVNACLAYFVLIFEGIHINRLLQSKGIQDEIT